jgi:membrane dipeptidase
MSQQAGISEDLKEHAIALHKEAILVDTHNIIGCVDDLEERKRGGLDCKVFLVSLDISPEDYDQPASPNNLSSAYETEGYPRRALNIIDRLYLDLDAHKDEIALALTASDIIENKRKGKLSIMIGFEGAKPLDGSLSLLRNFYRLGLRHLQFVLMAANQVSGSGWDPSGGMTNFGRALVKECNRLGVIIDVDLMSPAGFKEALELSEDPVIVGHSGVKALCPSSGHALLTDDQIRAIHEKGGMIGIHCWSRVLTRREDASLDNLVNHIDYIAKLTGSVDNIGFGTDFYPRREPWSTFFDLTVRGKPRAAGEALLSPRILVGTDASGLPDLTVALLSRGYSDNDVKKILGGNFLRVAKTVFGS